MAIHHDAGLFSSGEADMRMTATGRPRTQATTNAKPATCNVNHSPPSKSPRWSQIVDQRNS